MVTPAVRGATLTALPVLGAIGLAASLLWLPTQRERRSADDFDIAEHNYLHQQRRAIMATRRAAQARFSRGEEPQWSREECLAQLRSPRGEDRFNAIARLGRLGLSEPQAVMILISLLNDRESFYYQDHPLFPPGFICGQEFQHYPFQLAMEQLTQLGAVDASIAPVMARIVADRSGYPESTRAFAARQMRFMLVDGSTRSETIATLDAARLDTSSAVATTATCTMLLRGWPLTDSPGMSAWHSCGGR